MPETIFSKIIRREVPAEIVYEDSCCLAFRDISPQAPVHVLVIPKQPIESLATASGDNAVLLGHLLLKAAEIARQEHLQGWRAVINTGEEGGQTVAHLHVHVIGGRPLRWPPG